ncbi:hypothetical protein V6N13_066981 [Hibiscus sabdariffa]|uniref:Secreted protein n=1 Tax=Hibiscus sabdariffa TaxID=183260 RepID=A0ABR2DS15_9ROSI
MPIIHSAESILTIDYLFILLNQLSTASTASRASRLCSEKKTNRHHQERHISDNVKDHARLRIRPIVLALIELLGSGFPNQHGGFTHHSSTAGSTQEPSRFVEALVTNRSTCSGLAS